LHGITKSTIVSEDTLTKRPIDGYEYNTPQTKEISYSMSNNNNGERPGDLTDGTADSAAKWHMLRHLQDELNNNSNPKLFIEDDSSNEV